MSRMILTVKPAPKITTIVRGIGQPGPQGPAGQGFSQIASGTILGNGLGDPALPQALTGAAARSVMNAASLAGNSFSGKQTFTGTDHVGLCLNSLSTAQYNALAATNGDLFRDSTADRIDARLNRGTVELVDTAGGQVIGGNLAASTLMVGGASGPLFRNNAGTIEARNTANSAFVSIVGDSLFTLNGIYIGGTTVASYGVLLGQNFRLNNGSLISWSNVGTNPTGATADLSFSRNSANIGQIGNGGANASGSLLLTNLTASGTVKAQGNQDFFSGADYTRVSRAVGASGRLRIYRPNSTTAIAVQFGGGNDEMYIGQSLEGSLRVGGGSLSVGSAATLFLDSTTTGNVTFRGIANATMATLTGVGNLSTVGTVTIGTYTVGTLPSASANTRARAFVTDSNQTFNSANLGATVTAGGANLVPVFSNGTNWVIG